MEAVVRRRLTYPSHQEASNSRDDSAIYIPEPLTSLITNKISKEEAVAKHISRFIGS